jgi:hypothetical protein
MSYARLFWSIWQGLLAPSFPAFTRPGPRRFVEWVTALALGVEERTITGSVTARDRPADWKALEHFAESGAWDAEGVTRDLTKLVEAAPGRLWHGYRVSAVDDTEVHRNSKNVWGCCTFHEDTARCPNRAGTARAHNWVVLGALLEDPGRAAWFLPISGRLYFRKSQPPVCPGGTEPFRTECDLAVDPVREQARIVGGRHLAVLDGGYALKSVVRPLVIADEDSPRIEFLTRLRHDARLHALAPHGRREGQRGPTPKWGRKLPPPRQGGRWPGPWHKGEGFIYGRTRTVCWKEVVCLWRVSGHGVQVKVVVAKVEGYRKRFTLVTSAVELTGLQVVDLFAARFRQEDGFRDPKQRLGWEECRAWTRNPIERTSQAQWIAMSLLRLARFRLEAEGEVDWWDRPPWYPQKGRPSVRDVGRLPRRHRPEILQLLSGWPGDEGEVA